MTIMYGGSPEEIMVVRHGQSCTNIMGEAYSLFEDRKNPYENYGVGVVSPPKSMPHIWLKLAKISQDPPLNNGGLCELIELYEKKYHEFNPDKVYCSSMCRAIQTAMILYPNGGSKDNKIHICPWIQESPHGYLETKLTKKSRSSRDYSELDGLITSISHLYTYDKDRKPEDILPYMGNRYTSIKLVGHPITAKLVKHPLLEAHYRDDVNIERFIIDIAQKDEGNIAVISHGYTMRAGCKKGQLIDGWCHYFKEIAPRLIDISCLSRPYIDRPLNRPGSIQCSNRYVNHLRSNKNIPNGGVITINYGFDRGGEGSLDLTKFKVSSTESKLKDLYEYHHNIQNWVDRDNERLIFLDSIECLLRNLIYSWKIFAVGIRSYNLNQSEILSEPEGFCSRRLLELSNMIWDNRGSKLSATERDMFKPFLKTPDNIQELGAAKHRSSRKNKKQIKKKKRRKESRKKKQRKEKESRKKRLTRKLKDRKSKEKNNSKGSSKK